MMPRSGAGGTAAGSGAMCSSASVTFSSISNDLPISSVASLAGHAKAQPRDTMRRADRGRRRRDQRLGRGVGAGPPRLRGDALRQRPMRRANLGEHDEADPRRHPLSRARPRRPGARVAARARLAARASAAARTSDRAPLTRAGLRGGFRFFDAQTDDFAMTRAVVASAAAEGATVRENARVASLMMDGKQWIVNDEHRFDFIVNAAGPWMNELLAANHLRSRYCLTLVRGSHIVLRHRVADAALLLQSLGDRRIFFVLPWQGTTLVGTTEVLHTQPMNGVTATDQEIDYLA